MAATITITSATLATDGKTLTVPMGGVTGSLLPASGITGFTLYADGVSVAYASATASGSTVTLVASHAIVVGAYVQLSLGNATDPTSNLTDTGGNTPAASLVVATNNSIVVSGVWATLTQAQQIYSTDNINIWSGLAATGSADPLTQQGAFNRAANDMLTEFSVAGYQPPNPLYAQTLPYQPTVSNLAWIEAELMGVMLYEINGVRDAAKGIDGKMTEHRRNAMQNLNELLFLGRGGFSRITGFTDQFFGVAAQFTPGGMPVASSVPYPVLAWNGYQWVFATQPTG